MKEDVLNIRAAMTSNDADFAYSGDDAVEAKDDSDSFWIGIAICSHQLVSMR
jgi:hypothetical protein